MLRNVIRGTCRHLFYTLVVVISQVHHAVADYKLSVPGLIEPYGYPVETHQVQTDDGYILTLYRIPHGVSTSTVGEPVLVMHGFLCSSADFVDTGPGRALGFTLVDAGYDVWLGNFRGNTFSKKHINYSTSSNEFWNFSWHENGEFDLPAMIDYILDQTNKTQLFYIGHSMGATAFYVLMSLKSEYNSKIKLMCGLAPIAYINHAKSPVFIYTAPINRIEEWLFKLLGIKELLAYSEVRTKLKRFFCQEHAPTQVICEIIIFSSVGFDWQQLNKTQIPLLLTYFPAGASVKQQLHYSQEYISGHFRQWDYGKHKNMKYYGSPEPPDYNLSRTTAPTVLFYGDNDWFSSSVDVKRLYSSLGNPVKLIRVPYDKFNHLDFLWAIDAKSLLYDTILDIMKNYT